MYEDLFGLKGRPYLAAARVDRYYPAASIELARQSLTRSIERADGFGIVVGPTGTGKSLLCQVLAEQFGEQFKVAHLASGRLCSPRALMQAILYELGLPYRDMSEGELRLSLVDHLEPSADCPHGMLLVVDEAHSLPVRLFEEIRMLTNLVRDGMPRVRLVLAGNARLEERLNEPRLDSFSQRVIARCYLEPLGRDDTIQYVRAQFAAAGGDPDRVFDEAALIAVQRATDGIPRLVNQLCDHALILAFTAGADHLDQQRMEEAWADLQQLPPPWSETTQTHEATETTIEFGELDDPVTSSDVESESVPFVARFDEAEQPMVEDPSETVELDNEIQRAAQHLDQIDASIAQLNNEGVHASLDEKEDAEQVFQPLGTFQTEVQFDLAATPDPFGESFDEEEVVLDRYASMSASLAGRPQVYSTEGRAIADALAPHDVRPPSPRLAAMDDSANEHSKSTADVYVEAAVATEPEHETESRSAPESTEAICETHHEATEMPLIVIEEERDERFDRQTPPQPVEQVVPEPVSRVAVVEPKQFDRLFTNLRRNTGS